MEPCRSLALLTSSLGLVAVLVALSTNFWFVALGPSLSAHSGLWPSGDQASVEGRGPLVSTFTAFGAGGLSLGAHFGAPRPGYDTV
uniref:Natural killer cell granule protein 7 n=1 Tax=Catagonus wagneri TaxID=51154 RepID=A0A8C3WNT8_9CETA